MVLKRYCQNLSVCLLKIRKKDVANIKFEDIVCKINASTVLIRHKVSKLTLSYKLGQRKIIVNKQHVLNPAQANVFFSMD